MVSLPRTTLWRDWLCFAKTAHVKPDTTPLPVVVSDRLARDIAMPPDRLALHNHTWPSQSRQHPIKHPML